MTLSIIFFTEKGEILANKIKDICVSLNIDGRSNATSLYDGRNKQNPQSKTEWLELQMVNRNPIIFIGACGIAVRLIAPFIQNKLTDSPVLVIDEMGQYVIPVLSGHVGGANELAHALSEEIGATAVITTATDIEKKFAIDVFATQSGLTITNKEGIAKISSKVLRDEQVTIYIDNEIIEKYFDKTGQNLFQIGHYQWKLPKELTWINAPIQDCNIKQETSFGMSYNTKDRADIYIGRNIRSQGDLNLRIKEYVVGIGCRRGKPQAEIEEYVYRYCKDMDIDISQIAAVVSIDVKKDEEGLNGFCEKNRISFITYSKEVLLQAPGEFSGSAFVESKVGVDNVCERSVMTYISQWSKQSDNNNYLGNDTNVNSTVCNKNDNAVNVNSHLILGKQAENGMTIAIGKL